MGSLGDSLHEFAALGRSYPPFVTSTQELQRGEVPVFVFHTIEPRRFAAQLAHLAGNGYRTVGMDEYALIMAGALRGTGREVLLTIDDARSSVWRYAYPLLRKAGCKATTFAITGWTARAGRRANLDDVEAGRLTAAGLAALDADDRQVCTWEELAHMHASGHVEVECHTHLHQRLFCGEQVEDLVLRDSVRTASDAVFSPYLSVRDDPTALPADAFLGWPLTRTVPLMACMPAFRLSAAFASTCRDAFVELRSASASEPDASVARRVCEKLGRTIPESAITRLDRQALRGLIRDDLAASQASLRAGLGEPGAGRHLCLPFTIGSPDAVELARELGFQTVLWGVSPARRQNFVGSDPLATVRIKNDFIWRLPGTGRRSLTALYLEKVTRRLSGIAPY